MKSDEHIINPFVEWLRENFKRLTFKIYIPLNELVPKPKKHSLKQFWQCKWSHADISVFRHNKLCCIIEPGGYQHRTNKAQILRDKKKLQICKENKIGFLPLANYTLDFCEHKEFKKLLKCYFYQER